MSAVPQSAFAVCQIRKNLKKGQQEFGFADKYPEEEEKDGKGFGFGAKVLQEGREPTPLKYNSKLMNSIWGLYNRYSVHNFKKIDANEAGLLAWGGHFHPEAAAAAARSAVVVSSEGPTRAAAGIIGAAGH